MKMISMIADKKVLAISEIENKKAISSLLVAFLFSVLLWFCFFHFNFLYLAEEV